MDSVPIVAITCNVKVPLLGKDSFQEIDIAGITTPITKHNFIVKDVTKLADTIRRAFRIAQKGRPGPVLVDIPKDITAAKTEYEFCKAEPIARVTDTIRGRGSCEGACDDKSGRETVHICGRWCCDLRGERGIKRICT